MTEDQVQFLVNALREQFGGEVDFEAVNERGRYRCAITSKQFETMPHLRRQDEIWEVVDRILPRDATMDVSMILGFAPADLAGME